LSLEPNNPIVLGYSAFFLRTLGRLDEAIAIGEYGEADRAFAWLDKAVANGDPGLSSIAMGNVFSNLYEDTHWLPFLERIGRSPAQLAAIEFEVKLPE